LDKPVGSYALPGLRGAGSPARGGPSPRLNRADSLLDSRSVRPGRWPSTGRPCGEGRTCQRPRECRGLPPASAGNLAPAPWTPRAPGSPEPSLLSSRSCRLQPRPHSCQLMVSALSSSNWAVPTACARGAACRHSKMPRLDARDRSKIPACNSMFSSRHSGIFKQPS
jgi:hypothetical protein